MTNEHRVTGSARVEALLAELTLDEKAALCHGRDLWTISGCERVGIPDWTVSDGPIGIRGRGTTPTACFPSASAIAATFDLEVVEALGGAIGEEARAKNVQLALGPTVNLHRHPVTGRHFECYSEDPELTARVAVAYIRGLQATGVGACIKHYVANDQEHERFTISADVDERTLRELYLRPFEAAVAEADVRSVMGAYNFVNGIQACAHAELLQGVLKGEWGFDGVVVSDWTALKEGVGPGRNGLDLEMPGPGAFFGEGRLAGLVRAGEVPEAEVDDKVRRILGFLEWCGALDGTEATEAEHDTPASRAVARRAAVASMVLLTNDGTLPLDPAGLGTLAVIGPNAADTAALGGGSATVNPYRTVNVLDGLTERLAGQVEIVHEPGNSIRRAVPRIEFDDLTEERFTVEVLVGDRAGEPVAVLDRRSSQDLLAGDSWPGADDQVVTLRGRGTFVAPAAGTWRLAGGGLHHVRLWVDDDPLAAEPDADNQAPGSVNAGLGNHAGITERRLEAGQPVLLTFEYEVPPGGGLAFWTMSAGLLGDDVEAREAAALDAAVAAAAAVDVAVVVVGSNDEWESEGGDRADLDLPGDQDELVRRVAAVNPRTVVVLNSGSPMLLPWVDDVAAVVAAWYPGQEGGHAVADVLVGDEDPGGRMPTTWPRRLEDTPAHAWYPGTDGHAAYGEGLLLGHRWYETKGIAPQWWFGHGGSYTTFAWEVLDVTAEAAVVRVTNTGDRDGVEVVQAYVGRPDHLADEPPVVLAGFAKVALAPGAAEDVTVALSPAAFRRWDVEAHDWTVDPGDRVVRIARSADPAAVVATHTVTVGGRS